MYSTGRFGVVGSTPDSYFNGFDFDWQLGPAISKELFLVRFEVLMASPQDVTAMLHIDTRFFVSLSILRYCLKIGHD
jgi:hypothetical protein